MAICLAKKASWGAMADTLLPPKDEEVLPGMLCACVGSEGGSVQLLVNRNRTMTPIKTTMTHTMSIT